MLLIFGKESTGVTYTQSQWSRRELNSRPWLTLGTSECLQGLFSQMSYHALGVAVSRSIPVGPDITIKDPNP
jgi:hypothetical protein